MARKGIFDQALNYTPESVERAKPDKPFSKPVSAIGQTFREMSAMAEKQIDVALIDEGGLRDRLDIAQTDIEGLAEKIRENGQIVPVIVRPHPSEEDRYQIIYGRRRLAACRMLGIPIRALVREMNDEQLVVAQGQENTARVDLSFIEKAMFAHELEQADYSTEIIISALSANAKILSTYRTVINSVGLDTISRIGPAPRTGRPRWVEFAKKASLLEGNPAEHLPADLADMETSDERFEAAASAIARAVAGKVATSSDGHFGRPALPSYRLVGRSGEALGEMKRSSKELLLKVDAKENPDFAQWLEEKGMEVFKRLHEEFASAKS